MIDYARLPERVPLIFHGVNGNEKREASNPSLFNPQEVAVIKDYVIDLLTVSFQGDIVFTWPEYGTGVSIHCDDCNLWMCFRRHGTSTTTQLNRKI